MKILITGIAGFIGSNLAQRLISDGHEVLGIDNLSYGVREQVPSEATLYVKDIRSRDIGPCFEGVEAVFHLAAKNCISDCQADPVETMDINVMGTANILNTSTHAGVRKFIFAESAALYEGSSIFPTPETECAPETFYGVSKLAKHYLAESFQRYRGMKYTALRYFNAYGPRQDYRRTIPPVMSAFIIKLLQGETPIIYGTGERKRDFVHIDDINNFHVQCLTDVRTDGQVFNLGSGQPLSVNVIYGKICELLGVHVEPKYRDALEGEAEITWADIAQAQVLGWNPKIGIEHGLLTMIEYIKNEIHSGVLAK
jgi:nucleoside-diphosphate-sugar epimerase